MNGVTTPGVESIKKAGNVYFIFLAEEHDCETVQIKPETVNNVTGSKTKRFT